MKNPKNIAFGISILSCAFYSGSAIAQVNPDALKPTMNAVAKNRIIVAQDGSGDFKTIQEAITSIPEKNTAPIVVHIKPGTYTGQKILPAGKNNVRFEGEDAKMPKPIWGVLGDLMPA